MNDDLARDAITFALNANWEKALQTNLHILQRDSSDVDALNRLARSYAELGNFVKARESVQKVLKIDQFNKIAQKSLERWKGLKNGEAISSGPTSPQAFLEEPGKTKIVELMHLGSSETMAELDAGDEVKHNCHAHRVSIETNSGKYVGRLADDLSARLRRLVQFGYEYRMFLKSVDKNEIKVFIREIKRPAKLSDMPSFPAEKVNYISFTPPELIQDDRPSQDDNDRSEE
jgi:tetratricopeptide (TPR) repeat protein